MCETFNKYILWCSQQSNFQTRIMLIPYDDLPLPRKKQFSALKQYSYNQGYDDKKLIKSGIKDYIVTISLSDPEVPQSIVDLCDDMSEYADGNPYYYDNVSNTCVMGLFEEYDRTWIYNSKFYPCLGIKCGYDHLNNYKKFRNLTSYDGNPITIIEGFMVFTK